jgi:peptidyl-prolyl cis-trans isomerase D
MLQTIREKVEGWIATLILGLITVPFALWGINSYFDGDTKINAADVNGVKISVDNYRSALDQQRRAVQKYLGKNFHPSLIDTPEFKLRVAEQLVQEVLVTQAAHDQGYRIGDGQLAQLIKEDPNFQRDGKFDAGMYQALIRRSGRDARAVEANLRDELVKRQFTAGFGETVILVNSDLAAIVGLLDQKREIGYVTLTPDSFAAKVKLAPEAAEAHYRTHADRYTRPERVRIEYLTLSSEALAKKTKPGEDDLRRLYNEEIARYSTPEQRRASHILITLLASATAAEQQQALAKIEGLHKQAVAGADFAQLARQHSQDVGSSGNGGDLGLVERGLFHPEFEKAMLALKAGEIGKPVRTKDGYHLIKITSLKPEVRKPFAEVRDSIDKELRQRLAQEQFFEMAERFRTLTFEQADSLQPAAQALGLKIAQSDWFTRDGGAGIAADRKVVEAAFDPELRSQGRNSNAIETADNSLVVIRALAHEPAAQRPFAEVRSDIEQTLRQEAARRAAAKAGEDLLGALRSGGDLAALAKQQGLNYSVPKPFTRLSPAGIDPKLAEAVFKAARPVDGGAVHGGTELLNGAYAVYALRRVEPGRSEQADPKVKAQARQILNERRGAGLYTDYRNSLRKQASVKISADKL